jgi:hypothetical protein
MCSEIGPRFRFRTGRQHPAGSGPAKTELFEHNLWALRNGMSGAKDFS